MLYFADAQFGWMTTTAGIIHTQMRGLTSGAFQMRPRRHPFCGPRALVTSDKFMILAMILAAFLISFIVGGWAFAVTVVIGFIFVYFLDGAS